MKYLIALVVAVSLSFGVAIPAFADSGVSVTLTTTVVGNGGGGGGGGFDSGDSLPNSMPDWTKMFPSMLTQTPQSSPAYVPPVQQPIMIPPVVGNPPQYIAPVVAPVQEERDNSKDMYIYGAIGLGAILIGLLICLMLPDQRVR
jgi:hypothetical protein